MENLKPGQIRDEFVTPLMSLVGELNQDILKLESLIKDGTNPRDYIPLNVSSAKKGLGFLKKLRREIHGKIEGIQEGTFLFRERELEKRKEQRRVTKKKHS